MEQWTGQHRASVVEAYFKMAIRSLLQNDYFQNTLTFLVMAVFSVLTP
jgi:hypothetical protein